MSFVDNEVQWNWPFIPNIFNLPCATLHNPNLTIKYLLFRFPRYLVSHFQYIFYLQLIVYGDWNSHWDTLRDAFPLI